jgi:hypothetical protein
MDEAYTGSIISDMQGDAGIGGNGSARDETEALFADLLKDENEGLAVKSTSFYEYDIFLFFGGFILSKSSKNCCCCCCLLESVI